MKHIGEKVVRDTFSMLKSDGELILEIKKRCLNLGIETNKSELVRAGLSVLSKLSNDKLENVLINLPKMKTGRKKSNS